MASYRTKATALDQRKPAHVQEHAMTLPDFASPNPVHDPDTRGVESHAFDTALPAGPGWFESSWELRSGLEVIEGPGTVSEPAARHRPDQNCRLMSIHPRVLRE